MEKRIYEMLNERKQDTKTIIISAFPGCGKSTYYDTNKVKRKNGESKEIILDSDSSLFSWVYEDGVKTDKRNPDFPNNYIKHIKANIDIADVIFVSSHSEVRQALSDAGLDYVLIYPCKELKREYIERYTRRGNPIQFLNMMKTKFHNFVSQCKDDTNATTRVIFTCSQIGINEKVINTIREMWGFI